MYYSSEDSLEEHLFILNQIIDYPLGLTLHDPAWDIPHKKAGLWYKVTMKVVW